MPLLQKGQGALFLDFMRELAEHQDREKNVCYAQNGSFYPGLEQD